MIWKAKRGRLRERQRCQGGAGAPLPQQRGDPRGRAGQEPGGVKAAEQAVPGAGAKRQPRCQAAPSRAGASGAPRDGAAAQQRALCPTGRPHSGAARPCQGCTGGPPCYLTPNGRGQMGALITLWGTQSTAPPQPSLLPQLPLWGTQRFPQSDGGGEVPAVFGCILTQGPSQSP